MTDNALLVISTFPDAETARRITRDLVTERLAACANIIPAIESIYRWEGKIEQAQETLAFIKTTRSRFPHLETRLKSLHPYDVPEIIALAVTTGSPDYLQWVAKNCS